MPFAYPDCARAVVAAFPLTRFAAAGAASELRADTDSTPRAVHRLLRIRTCEYLHVCRCAYHMSWMASMHMWWTASRCSHNHSHIGASLQACAHVYMHITLPARIRYMCVYEYIGVCGASHLEALHAACSSSRLLLLLLLLLLQVFPGSKLVGAKVWKRHDHESLPVADVTHYEPWLAVFMWGGAHTQSSECAAMPQSKRCAVVLLRLRLEVRYRS
jgi:hypothetical protein